MDINIFKYLQMFEKAKPGIYPLKDNYKVLKTFSVGTKLYKPGENITLTEQDAKKLLNVKAVVLLNDRYRWMTVCDILDYIDQRTPDMPDVEFSSDFTSIKIYPKIHVSTEEREGSQDSK